MKNINFVYLLSLLISIVAACSDNVITSTGEAIKLEDTSTIKGELILNLGSPSEEINSVVAGLVTLSYEAANNIANLEPYKTIFDININDVTIKVVKYSVGESTDNFDDDLAYENEAILDQDFFIIRITNNLENNSIYYKIIVTVNPRVYSLRDTGPAGGYIFYVDPIEAKLLPEGITYLEAAPIDQSEGIAWSNITDVLIGTTKSDIGSGQENTDAIINQVGHNASAAKICADLEFGGYIDWYLPSQDELYKMYINLQSGIDDSGNTFTPVGGFILGDKWYWSSSENNFPTQALMISFELGNNYSSYEKSWPNYVRAIRAF